MTAVYALDMQHAAVGFELKHREYRKGKKSVTQLVAGHGLAQKPCLSYIDGVDGRSLVEPQIVRLGC